MTQSLDDYTTKVAAVMAPMAVSVTGIHSVDDPIAAIESTEMVIIGGGNTFQLLKECRSRGLLAPIVDVVKRGALYIGWSAGSNLACPTIRTTNDMPIVDPQGFDALGLFRYRLTRTSPTRCRPGIRAKPANSVSANCWSWRRN